jgi:S1-C subfamily serine protease
VSDLSKSSGAGDPPDPARPGAAAAQPAGSVPLFLASLAAWRAVNDPAATRTLPDEVRDAVVKLSIRTIESARTGQTLGTEREGTGVVIRAEGADGEDSEGGALILTIGYLVIEAQSVLVITRDNRVLSASVIGFDHATGFGLLRASARVTDHPLELGDSSAVREMQPLYFVAHEGAGGASAATVVSRRPFVGYWEYMLAEAFFTVPGRSEHSGAALVDAEGRLAGVASLWVGDALDQGSALPGNMFVPIDLLRPLLPDLIAHGRGTAPARPWLGVYTAEHDSKVVVAHVMDRSPAQRVGIREGDVIISVAADPVATPREFYEKLWAAGSAGARIRLRVLRGRLVLDALVSSIDRIEFFHPWTVRR